MLEYYRMELVTQHYIISRDLNAHGHLFGGTVLAWLDEAGAVYIIGKTGYSNIVTVSMHDVSFRSPGKLGHIVKIYTEIIKKGKSSITVRVDAVNETPGCEKQVIIDCTITYVFLDNSGKPYPYFEINENA